LHASEEADAEAFAKVLSEDVRFSMPPEPGHYAGRDVVLGFWSPAFDREGFGRVRGLATRANLQPAVALYLQPPGESGYRPMALDVIAIEDGQVAEVVTFAPELFPALGLPAAL
jgi:SnoaL-like domain